MQEIHHYDIVVIGSGPAGEKAALQTSKLKKQVALIEKSPHWVEPLFTPAQSPPNL